MAFNVFFDILVLRDLISWIVSELNYIKIPEAAIEIEMSTIRITTAVNYLPCSRYSNAAAECSQIFYSKRNEHVFTRIILVPSESVMWQQQDHSNVYAGPSSYYPPQQQEPLQFYAQSQDYYSAARSSLDGHVQGSISQQPAGFGGNIQSQGGWWTAFGTGGIEGEPPLLEGEFSTIKYYLQGQVKMTSLFHQELGINFHHIRAKTLTVLNPLRRVDEHIMDDADLAGPIFFIFCFGISLLFVSFG
jgi:hypothetical protein